MHGSSDSVQLCCRQGCVGTYSLSLAFMVYWLTLPAPVTNPLLSCLLRGRGAEGRGEGWRATSLLAGGEPIVQLTGKGRGGRNQELALRVWLELGGMALPPKGPLFLSGGTDGQDGPTEAAGAVTDAGLGEEARAQGLDTEGFLINNDSFTFFSHLSGGQRLLLPGLTGNNVMDVHILLIPPIPIVVSGH